MNSGKYVTSFSKFLPFLLGLIVLLAYGKILPTFFVQDDFWFLRDTLRPASNHIMLAGGLPEYLRPIPAYWLPLLNQYVWGLNPCGFHISQMACLLLTVYALFRIVVRWTGSATAASVAALVFGLSKIHLWSLGWITGSIENAACCFMVLTLLAIIRYQQGEGRLWPIGVACALGLLSKESTVILIPAWVGAIVIRSILAKVLPPETATEPAAKNHAGPDGTIGRESTAGAGGWLTPAELRTGLLLAGIVVGYALLRMSLIAPTKHVLGLSLGRFSYVLASSVLAVLPIPAATSFVGGCWLLLPLAVSAGAVLLRPWHKAHEVVLAFLLWVLHAAIFGVSISLPSGLQIYYALFNVVGLALLSGLFCAGVLQHIRPRWAAIPARAVIVALLAFYAYQSVGVIREGIENASSPSLFAARYSEEAYLQLRCFLRDAPQRTILFLNASDEMWWAMGKGDMIPIMFAGVQANFEGHDGFHAPPGAKTDATTLVVRQTSALGFAVVR